MGVVLKMLGILTERWEAGGGLIFTREANIAEMDVSEPSKNALKVLQKKLQKKLEAAKIYDFFIKTDDFARIPSIFDGISMILDQILSAPKKTRLHNVKHFLDVPKPHGGLLFRLRWVFWNF